MGGPFQTRRPSHWTMCEGRVGRVDRAEGIGGNGSSEAKKPGETPLASPSNSGLRAGQY